MTYKERKLCPQCGNTLTTRHKPHGSDFGEKYCEHCHTTHTFDIWAGEPITVNHTKAYKPRTLVKGQICEVCGATFEWYYKKKTCCHKCAKLLAGRNARNARLRNLGATPYDN